MFLMLEGFYVVSISLFEFGFGPTPVRHKVKDMIDYMKEAEKQLSDKNIYLQESRI